MAKELNAKSPASKAPQAKAAAEPRNLAARLRGALRGPLLIGLIAALVAIGLSLYGMVVNHAAPVSVSSVVLVIVVAGGAWGLIAWAIATAAVEAGKE